MRMPALLLLACLLQPVQGAPPGAPPIDTLRSQAMQGNADAQAQLALAYLNRKQQGDVASSYFWARIARSTQHPLGARLADSVEESAEDPAMLRIVGERSDSWRPGMPSMPYAQGVFGYLPQLPADAPLPPYTILQVTDAVAFPASGSADAALTVVLAGQPVDGDCSVPSAPGPRASCAVFTLARDGRVLSGHWHGSQPYAFPVTHIDADFSVADGWLRGSLRARDDVPFTATSAVVNVTLEAPCRGCK